MSSLLNKQRITQAVLERYYFDRMMSVYISLKNMFHPIWRIKNLRNFVHNIWIELDLNNGWYREGSDKYKIIQAWKAGINH